MPAPQRPGWIRSLALAGALLSWGCGSESQTSVEAPPRRETPNQASVLGYNLDFPGDWTNQPPFIDLIENSRAPAGDCSAQDPDCDPVAHLDLASDGWPRSLRYRDDPSQAYQSIQIIISSGNDGADVGQRFLVTWEGSGRIELENATDVQVDAAARRISFTLQSDATFLRLVEVDPQRRGDYLKNIRVFRAGFEPLLLAGEIFDPETLDFLVPFRSLRFMDWMQSNAFGQCSGGSRAGENCYAITDDDCGSGRCLMPGNWDERPRDDAPSRLASGQYLDPAAPELGTKVGGYALETMVALANRVPADPHFNIPAAADDAFVQGFAEYLKDHLAPGLVASIEYSNEVWNWGFPQAEYANQRGLALWPDESSAWVQFMAGRTQQVCRIVKRVFRGQEQRIRCLISPQTGWRSLAETVLDCPAWAADHPETGACSSGIDAVNITGYFAGCLPNHEELIEEWLSDGQARALDLGFEQLEHGGRIEDCRGEDEDNLDYTIDGYRYFSELAAQRGLGLYVYESGTHFSYEGENDAVRDFFVAMTRDERMHDAYTRNFRGFLEHGGEILNVWGWIGPDDMWANADSIRDRAHPKYRAITDFVAAQR
ncbi:MAG TPA: hypothetical protein VJU61_03265 [Polyangiaceae bacterium]|nr:hypothetical protein [Polyangiaceae bacterium]